MVCNMIYIEELNKITKMWYQIEHITMELRTLARDLSIKSQILMGWALNEKWGSRQWIIHIFTSYSLVVAVGDGGKNAA
jgi:hypothetical protein